MTQKQAPLKQEEEGAEPLGSALGDVPPAADLAALEKALKKKAKKEAKRCGCWENS